MMRIRIHKTWQLAPFLTLRAVADQDGCSLRLALPTLSIPLVAITRARGLSGASVDDWAQLARCYTHLYESMLSCVNVAGDVLPDRAADYQDLLKLAGRELPEITRRRRIADQLLGPAA